MARLFVFLWLFLSGGAAQAVPFIVGVPPIHSMRTLAERLIIEITETAAVSDLTDAERFIEALKQAGMFIRNLPHDHDNQVFVRGMVEVARGLGKTTVAECVEDEATLDLLAALGVDKAQGYFLDRPQARHPALFPGDTP